MSCASFIYFKLLKLTLKKALSTATWMPNLCLLGQKHDQCQWNGTHTKNSVCYLWYQLWVRSRRCHGFHANFEYVFAYWAPFEVNWAFTKQLAVVNKIAEASENSTETCYPMDRFAHCFTAFWLRYERSVLIFDHSFKVFFLKGYHIIILSMGFLLLLCFFVLVKRAVVCKTNLKEESQMWNVFAKKRKVGIIGDLWWYNGESEVTM